MTIFQRLSEGLEDVSWELRHFIQEKDPVVGKTDFTGLGDCSAPDHGDVADRMVWVAIGSGPDQSIPLGQSRNRVQFSRLQAFLKCH